MDSLIDYFSGQADAETAERIRRHLDAGCPTCGREAVWMSRALPALREQSVPEAPDSALTAARARFREIYGRKERQTIFARLRFDSRTQPAFALARGDSGRTIQAVYESSDHDIELWQEENEDGSWYLIGQVLPRGEGGSVRPETVTLTGPDGTLHESAEELDTLPDEFHVDRVPAGVYAIRLRLPELDLQIEDVVVGQ
jgi:hypothetical protein